VIPSRRPRPRRRAARAAALAVLAAILSATPLPAQKLPQLEPRAGRRVGDLAHDFTLKDLDGKTYRLKDLRGKVVHVVFWATWCVPCMQEIPMLREHYAAWRDRGLEVLGVVLSMNQTPQIVRAVSQTYKVNYPVLFDGDDVVRDKYRVETIPRNFLIDKKGVIRYADTVLPADYDALIRMLLAEGGPAPAPAAASH
jgi:peroxiredoxin